MRTIAITSFAVLLVACSAKEKSVQRQAAPVSRTATVANAAPSALPANHPAIAPTTQVSTEAAAKPSSNRGNLSGKVIETTNAAGYTYIKLRTGSGDVWAAVRQTNVKVGSNVALNGQMVLDNFESKTLNRKFDHIVFATMADGSTPVVAAAMASSSAPADHSGIKVSRADGGQTIGEIWAQKGELAGKPVVIRGKVVKFLPEIMGKNWLHLRDGTGSPEKGDDDVTVTTSDSAKVGDVITVRGTLRVDKDFGAGYRYPVIVEDAKISQ